MSSSSGVAPDVLFAQKASAVAKCAGMDPRSMDLERFRSLAPVIFSKAFSTIYKEKLPLNVSEEPEDCMQYVIEGLLDKTNVGALTLITGVDVCSGSHRAIGVLVGVLFAEGQRMWLAKQEAKARAEVERSDSAGVPSSGEKRRPGSAVTSSRTTPQKGGLGEIGGTGSALKANKLPSVNARPGSAAPRRVLKGPSKPETGNDKEDGEGDGSEQPEYDEDDREHGAASADGKKRRGKKGKRVKRRGDDGSDEDAPGVGLEEGMELPPSGAVDQSPEKVKHLLQRVAYLEGKLKIKKEKRAGSPKRMRRARKPHTGSVGVEEGSSSAADLSPTKGLSGKPARRVATQQPNRPSSAPSGAGQSGRKLHAVIVEPTPTPEKEVPEDPFARLPASHFTYDMKSGRRILLSTDEIEARERRRELYQLGEAREGGISGDSGSMPGLPGGVARPPVAPYSPPPAEPTRPAWPGPSTGHSTEGWVKRQRAARDLAQLEAEAKAAAVASFSQPRYFAAYQKLENDDLVISVEHCVNCHCHNVTLRHNPKEYITNADSTLVSLAHFAHESGLACRVGVTRFPADITAKTRESDANSRVGAFEIQVAYRSAQGSVHTELLHSKLSTRRWPSKQVLEKRFKTFCSKYKVPAFFVSESDRDELDYAEFQDSPQGDGYPVGAGPWERVTMSVPLWQFRPSDYDAFNNFPTSPTKKKMVGKDHHRSPTVIRTARAPVAVADDTPNASNTASLNTVHWAWDSRGYTVEPKFTVGQLVHVSAMSLVNCNVQTLKGGMGTNSAHVMPEWLSKSPLGTSGLPRQPAERYPLLGVISSVSNDSTEMVTVRPKYFALRDDIAVKQYQCVADADIAEDLRQEIAYAESDSPKSDKDMPIALEAVLTLWALLTQGKEPTPDGPATFPDADTKLVWASLDSKDSGSSRTRGSVFHALRDIVSLLLGKYLVGASEGELDGDRSPTLFVEDSEPGEMRHPVLINVLFQPNLAYCERSLSWLEAHCDDGRGGIDVRKAQGKAYGVDSAMRYNAAVNNTSAAAVTSDAHVAEVADANKGDEGNEESAGEMVDPSEMGAFAVRTTEGGSTAFDMGEMEKHLSPQKKQNQKEEQEGVAVAAGDVSASPQSEAPGGEASETSPKAAETGADRLKGKLMDPTLADFLDGLGDDDDDDDEDAAAADAQGVGIAEEEDPMLADFMDGIGGDEENAAGGGDY